MQPLKNVTAISICAHVEQSPKYSDERYTYTEKCVYEHIMLPFE